MIETAQVLDEQPLVIQKKKKKIPTDKQIYDLIIDHFAEEFKELEIQEKEDLNWRNEVTEKYSILADPLSKFSIRAVNSIGKVEKKFLKFSGDKYYPELLRVSKLKNLETHYNEIRLSIYEERGRIDEKKIEEERKKKLVTNEVYLKENLIQRFQKRYPNGKVNLRVFNEQWQSKGLYNACLLIEFKDFTIGIELKDIGTKKILVTGLRINFNTGSSLPLKDVYLLVENAQKIEEVINGSGLGKEAGSGSQEIIKNP